MYTCIINALNLVFFNFAFFFCSALFLCGRNRYKKVPPEGNIVLLVGCAVGVCTTVTDYVFVLYIMMMDDAILTF